MATNQTAPAKRPDRFKIPELAYTAAGLTQQKFQQELSAIGHQAIASLGLDPADGWNVNFDSGYITKAKRPPAPAPANPSARKKRR